MGNYAARGARRTCRVVTRLPSAVGVTLTIRIVASALADGIAMSDILTSASPVVAKEAAG